MTEDYCDFEIAMLLKEKGFDENCAALYDLRNGAFCEKQTGYVFNNSQLEDFITAPTLQMALKWLREVHSCYIVTYWEFKNYDENGNPVFKDIIWSYNISIPKYNSARNGDGDYFDIDSEKEDYPTYEEVCEAAIKYCLENLI